jgi:hypothetical protein
VWLPELAAPLSVSVYVPAAALGVVAKLSVADWPDETLVGLIVAVTPAGAPLMLRATVWAVPAVVAVLIVAVPLLPATTATVVGDAAIEKSFPETGALTITATVAVWLPEGAVPVIVNGKVPTAALGVVVIDSVVELPEVTLLDPSVAATPLGAPLTCRLTVCAEPAVTLVLIAEVPPLPALTLMETGFALSPKSLAGVLIGWTGGKKQVFCALLNSS